MSGRPDSFVPLYVADYYKDTRHLSAAEHGAYLLLIFHYWNTGVPLLDDDVVLARIACMTPQEWKRSGKVVRAFFRPVVMDGDHVLTHKRIEQELSKANARYDQRKVASDAGVLARQAKRDAIRDANRTVNRAAEPSVEPEVQPGANRIVNQLTTHNLQSPSEIVPEAKASGGVNAANGHDGKPAWWPTRDRYRRITSEITDKLVYDMAKIIIGSSSGGQITKLRKARYDMRSIADLLMQADDTSTPREWFAQVVRKAEIDERTLPRHEIYPEAEYRT